MGSCYKYYQPNKLDLKDDHGDCVVRCLTKVMNKSWLEVFDELVIYAREIQCMPNDKLCYEKYLREHGFTYTGISNKKGSKRPMVYEFAHDNKHSTCVLVLANHLVACVDGIFYDTWECSHKCLYGYWSKVEELLE